MIVRSWSAIASPAGGDAYEAHLQAHVLPTVRQVHGYCGLQLLRRLLPSGHVECVVLTYWSNWDAVRRFAGDELSVAVVAPAARELLVSFDTEVRHFELIVDERPGASADPV